MLRKLFSILLCLGVAFSLTACLAQRGTGERTGKVKVAVSFDAIKEFVKAVGGDRVTISTIIPDGTEPHDFEPKPKDLAVLGGAGVFVINGLDMESSWADKAVQAAGGKGLVRVDASKGAEPIEADGKSQPDPHLWLSLKGAELEAENIRNGLIEADPAGTAVYRQNCTDFVARLEALYNQYAPAFAAAPNKHLVTGHAAFAYLCRDFGLEQDSVEDVFAEGEPSAQQLITLMDYCRRNKVRTVFSEDMVSPAISETLADSVGAKVVPIYTMESSENGKSYLDRMASDLAEIAASFTSE